MLKLSLRISISIIIISKSCNIHSKLCFSFAGIGVLICSIDNMPAQMPREATDYFGGLLLPYIPEIVKNYFLLFFL